MKNLVFFMFIYLLLGCSNNKEVFWCGDHACINKKERKAFFRETMIVEKKELNGENKLNKYQKDEILKKIRSKEKKKYKDDKSLRKQSRLEKKKEIKEEKELAKQKRLEDKKIIKEEKELAKQVRIDEKKLFKKNKKRISEKENIISTNGASVNISAFKTLVEKITKRNMSRPYPNINDIPN